MDIIIQKKYFQKKNENENDINKNNEKNLIKKIIINKNKSTSLLYSNFNKSINSVKKSKISSLYLSPINSGNNLDDKKTLFKKLNYLKYKSPTIGNMKLKLRNKNNLESNLKGNNHFISEEINESIEKNIYSLNNKNLNIKSLNNNSNYIELNNILSRDYNEISDTEYRELLNKKEQYLESNLRLEKNINEIKRTKNKKIFKILRIVQENEFNLGNIKNQNNLIEKEIYNLYNVFLLTVEQAKLKNEINHKKLNSKKKYKLTKESVINEETKLFKSINKYNYNKNLEDILIPKKREIKIFEENKNIKKKNRKENRDEQLKLIKEKYKDVNIILNEDNQLNEIEKDRNEDNDKFINKINNEKSNGNIKEPKENNNELNQDLNKDINNEIYKNEIKLNEKNIIHENNYEKEDMI